MSAAPAPLLAQTTVPFTHVIIDTHGPTDPWGKAVGDINGDGKIDLVVGGQTAGGLVWYENPGWVKHTISTALGFRTDLQVVDVDRDGLNDVVALAADADQNPLVGWYKNPGATGAWTLTVIEPFRALHDAKVADLNGDGKIDVVARDQQAFSTHHGDTVHVYIQVTPSSWTHVRFPCVNGEGLRVADVNGDGKPDIIVSGTWFENSGTGLTWTPHQYTTTYTYTSVTVDVADVNGDGRPDIILEPAEPVGSTYRASWFEAPADPRVSGWTEHIIESNIETDHHFVGAADFNNDGVMDIASAEQTTGAYPHTVKVFLNAGGGLTWKKEVFDSAGSHNDRIADISGNGNMDIFGANWLGNQVDLFVNHSKPRAPIAKTAAQVTSSGFRAGWTSVRGAANYRLDVASDTAFLSPVAGYANFAVTDTGQAVASLNAGTTYYYRVRSETVNGASANSNRIAVTTLPGPPQAPVARPASAITTTGFTANWDSSATAAGYRLDIATDSLFAGGFVKNDTALGNVLSFTVTGLTPGTSYYYRVRAFNSGGTGPSSNRIAVTTISLDPPPPVALPASGITSGGFTANWGASSGATGYRLDIAADSLFLSGVVKSDTPVGNFLSFPVTGLAPSTAYYYRVRGFNVSGTSPSSNRVTATTLPLPPAPPVPKPATLVTATGFRANWTPVAGASGYRLDVSADISFGSFVGAYNNIAVVDTGLVVTSLSLGTIYYYRVRSENAGGASASSAVVTLITVPPAPPALPGVAVSKTGFTAAWNGAAGATGYRLDVASDSLFLSGFVETDSSSAGGLSSPVTGLNAGTTYYYRVRAFNVSGTSVNSNRISVTTLPDPPLPPVARAATAISAGGFTAHWDSSSGAIGYRLDVGTDSLFVSGVVKGDTSVGNVLAASITGLSPATLYYYRVRGTNSGGEGGNSNIISVVTLSLPPAAPLARPATGITSGGFTAHWDSVATAVGYRFDLSTDSLFATGFLKNDTALGNVLAISLPGLSPGTSYFYRVRALNGGGTGPNSNTISQTTLPLPPPAPLADAATLITSSGFRANWGSSPGAAAYRLDVAIDSTFQSGYVKNDTLLGNVLFAPVTGLLPASSYYYRVRAVNAGGTGPNSNRVTAVTLPLAPQSPSPKPATLVTATGFHANWSPSPGATLYRLDVSTDILFGTFAGAYNNIAVSDTGFVVSPLTQGTPYYYRVRAENIGGTSGNSSTVSVVTVPPPPVALSGTSITRTGFTALWNAAQGATGYRIDVATDSLFASGLVESDSSAGGALSSTVTELNPGALYYYRVRAFNAGGTSGNSNRVLVTTLPNPPAAPIAENATGITGGGFTAHWDSSAGSTGYRLDVATDSLFLSGFVRNDSSVGNVRSASIAGLTPATFYYYRVRAVNTGGSSPNSNRISLLTLPLAPIPPLARPATFVSGTGFSANWGSVPGASGYRLDVSQDNLFGSFISGFNNLALTDTTEPVTSLNPGTAYYYRVRAVNDGGTSGNSAVTAVTTIPIPPFALPAGSVTSTSFRANWNASAGASSYRLDVASDSLFQSGFAVNDTLVGGLLSWPLSGLQPSVTYYYRVRAANSGGVSGNSNRISATTLPSPPTAPVAIAATSVTSTGFTARWDSSHSAAGYRLDVALDSLFASGFVKTDTAVGNVLAVAVAGLSPGTPYFYRVRASNSGGVSGNSNRISVSTLPSAPQSPLAAPATGVTSGGFTANWGGSPGATGYRLDVSSDSLFSSGMIATDSLVGNILSTPIAGLFPATAYYYRVRATNAGGTSPNSNRIAVTTLPLPPGPPPAEPATNVTAAGFRANWGKSAGATGYRLDVSGDPAFGSFTGIYHNLAVSDTTQVVGSLAAGTAYYYRVRAENSGGTSGNSGTVTVLTVPPPPVAVSAGGVSNTGFTAHWDSSASASGYRLDVAADSLFAGGAVKSDTSVGNVLAASISGLTPGTLYYYRVRAVNGSGTSVNSNRISVATLPNAPGPPLALGATAVTASGFAAHWTAAAGASGYRLDVAPDSLFGSGFVENDTLVGNVLSSPVIGLLPATTYYYRVRAANSGGTSGNSNRIAVTTLPPPPGAPVAKPATLITATGFRANWSPSPGASAYGLDVSTDVAFGTFTGVYHNLSVSDTTQSVTPLSPGTVYFFRVRAESAGGTSPNSLTITTVTVPPAPVALSANSVTKTGFTAAWNAATGASGYRLDVASDSLFVTGIVRNDSSVGNQLSAAISGIAPGVTFYYRVRATNSGGTSPSSNRVAVTTVPNPPGVPVAKPATGITISAFRANWGPVAGAAGYRLDVSVTNTFISFLGTYNNLSVADTALVVTSLAPGTVYFYRIRAENSGGASGNSTVISLTTIPPPPVALPATGLSTKGFTALWNAAAGAAEYRVDLSADSSFSAGAIWSDSSVGSVLSVPVTGLNPGTTYYFRVRASNDAGTGQSSNRVPVTTLRVALSVRVFLQGPTINDTMQTALKRSNLVPRHHPYGGVPWNYSGTDSASRIPDSTVDWVLVALRSDSAMTVARRAALLMASGMVTDTDGVGPVRFSGIVDGNYFVVVYHRNHLAVMSRTPVALSGTSSLYDFSSAQNQAFGSLPMALVGSKFCMMAGDANGDGGVTILDRVQWRLQNGTVGYLSGDMNLSGDVTILDRVLWRLSNGLATQVP